MPTAVEVLEERLKQMNKQVTDSQDRTVKKLDQLEAKIDKLISNMDSRYVTRQEFFPVRAIAYTIVSVAGVAVLGALIKLILN